MLAPLVNQEGMTLFMATIGVTFILEGVAQMMFGADVYPLPAVSERCLVPVRESRSRAAFW